MNRRILFGICFTLALAGCGRGAPDGHALAGRWTPESATLGGRDLPVANFQGATLRMTAEDFDFGGHKSRYKVISLTPPARMDITALDGPLAGHVAHAIFRLAGDRLTLCYRLDGGNPPSDFVSPPGSQIVLIRYRRMP